MSKKVTSAKGQAVDFDLMRIKQQMAVAPRSTQVVARENFIDQRLKRRVRKAVQTDALTVPVVTETTPTDDTTNQSE